VSSKFELGDIGNRRLPIATGARPYIIYSLGLLAGTARFATLAVMASTGVQWSEAGAKLGGVGRQPPSVDHGGKPSGELCCPQRYSGGQLCSHRVCI